MKTMYWCIATSTASNREKKKKKKYSTPRIILQLRCPLTIFLMKRAHSSIYKTLLQNENSFYMKIPKLHIKIAAKLFKLQITPGSKNDSEETAPLNRKHKQCFQKQYIFKTLTICCCPLPVQEFHSVLSQEIHIWLPVQIATRIKDVINPSSAE